MWGRDWFSMDQSRLRGTAWSLWEWDDCNRDKIFPAAAGRRSGGRSGPGEVQAGDREKQRSPLKVMKNTQEVLSGLGVDFLARWHHP